MRFNKQIIFLIPKILALFSLLISTLFFLINKSDTETVKNKSGEFQSFQQKSSIASDEDVVYCDKALAQEDKDELSMLVNQEEPQSDPCLYMGCSTLF